MGTASAAISFIATQAADQPSPLLMHPSRPVPRRTALAAILGSVATLSRAEPPQPIVASRSLAVIQIADMSAGQTDVTKDFLAGSRTAWQEINAKGGLKGRRVQHMVVEVDGSAASVRSAIDTIKGQPSIVAAFGSVGAQAAAQVASLLQREIPDIAHIAPWLQQPHTIGMDNTFPIFASRQAQITHAIKSLSATGVTEIGVVFANAYEHTSFRTDMEQLAASTGVSLKSYGPSADLQQLGKNLPPQSPRILVFLGGTPELVQFSQGIEQQAMQRYIVAMSDVNVQTLSQMRVSRLTPVIATQVVPMVNSSAVIVRNFRDALSRYLDEPPTPQSLAGYVSARYTFEVLQSVEGVLTRNSLLSALQRRGNHDMGGFPITLDVKHRSGNYVTQSMISADGRIVG
jgi:ABC-type branched-subunit amino acid transport system substrate-binding protein